MELFEEHEWSELKRIASTKLDAPAFLKGMFLGWMKALYERHVEMSSTANATAEEVEANWLAWSFRLGNRFRSEILAPYYAGDAEQILSDMDVANIAMDVNAFHDQVIRDAERDADQLIEGGVHLLRNSEGAGPLVESLSDEDLKELLHNWWEADREVGSGESDIRVAESSHVEAVASYRAMLRREFLAHVRRSRLSSVSERARPLLPPHSISPGRIENEMLFSFAVRIRSEELLHEYINATEASLQENGLLQWVDSILFAYDMQDRDGAIDTIEEALGSGLRSMGSEECDRFVERLLLGWMIGASIVHDDGSYDRWVSVPKFMPWLLDVAPPPID